MKKLTQEQRDGYELDVIARRLITRAKVKVMEFCKSVDRKQDLPPTLTIRLTKRDYRYTRP